MSARWGLGRAAAAGAAVGLLLAAVLSARPGQPWSQQLWIGRFTSNGERIYFTATSERGTPIYMSTGSMPMGGMPMGGMRGAMMACADCHGADGRGGSVSMMMGTFEAPDIRYATLTGQPSSDGHEGDHEPYNEGSLREAITSGIDPAGQPLDFPMPRWRLTDADLADVVAHLKTLP